MKVFFRATSSSFLLLPILVPVLFLLHAPIVAVSAAPPGDNNSTNGNNGNNGNGNNGNDNANGNNGNAKINPRPGPQGNPQKNPHRSRGSTSKFDTTIIDLSTTSAIDIQGQPGKRLGTVQRKRFPGAKSEEWYGETIDGDGVANLLPCRGAGNAQKMCGNYIDYVEEISYIFGLDADGDSTVVAIPLNEFPDEDEPQLIDEEEEEEEEEETTIEAAAIDAEGNIIGGGGGTRQRHERRQRGLAGNLRANADRELNFRTNVVEPALNDSTNTNLRSTGSNVVSRRLQTAVMDVMVLWTKKAECAAANQAEGCTLTSSTTSNMETLIDLAVQETNTAYSLSGIDAQLRLVHAYRDDTYVETGSSSTLSDLRGTSDGNMDDAHTKRTTYGADLVAIIIELSGSTCGVATVGPSIGVMFSVTVWDCATGYFSFGHEIGHNLGCLHDRDAMNQCTNSGYNYGWRDPSASFRTILAYSCSSSNDCWPSHSGGGCTRIQRFSNPTGTYGGKALGDANNDNARQINDVAATVAAYYPANNPCSTGADCSDGDSCTQDVCSASGVCVNPDIVCDDSDVCTTDSCSGGTCVYSPISCDDGNSCTTDLCDAVTGCYHVAIAGCCPVSSCDDGDSCTTDLCDPVTGCYHESVPNCCGNGICEAGEDAISCVADCALGPFDLTPPYNPTNVIDGVMFDVKTKMSKLQVQTIRFYPYGSSGTIEVWTKTGSHVGSTGSLSSWSQVATHSFTGGGCCWNRLSIPTSSFTAVDVDPAVANGVRAFYVAVRHNSDPSDTVIMTSGTAAGTLFASDSNVEIFEGTGKVDRSAPSFAFYSYSGGYRFMGAVEYLKIPDVVATPSPVVAATEPPSKVPTPGPTLECTNHAECDDANVCTLDECHGDFTCRNYGCDANASCQAEGCVCNGGYEGDGFSCSVILTSAPSDKPSSSPSEDPASPVVSDSSSPSSKPSASPVVADSSSPSSTPSRAPSPTNSVASNAVFGLELETDQWPGDTSWDLKDSSDTTVLSGGDYQASTTYTVSEDTLDPLECYTFTIFDSWGDGLCCDYGSGSYRVTFNGDMKRESPEGDAPFSSESVTFGNCGGVADTSSPSSKPSASPVVADSSSPSSKPSASPVVADSSSPSSKPSASPVVADSSSPSSTPSRAPSPTNSVASNAVFDILLVTDQWPGDTSWDLKNSIGTTVFSDDGPYQGETEYNFSMNLDPSECYTFTIFDSWGDGLCCTYGNGMYRVTFDGTVEEGGVFGGPSESVDVGNCQS